MDTGCLTAQVKQQSDTSEVWQLHSAALGSGQSFVQSAPLIHAQHTAGDSPL